MLSLSVAFSSKSPSRKIELTRSSSPKKRSLLSEMESLDLCLGTKIKNKFLEKQAFFRVGNLRNSLIVQCKIRAKFVRSRHTEGIGSF